MKGIVFSEFLEMVDNRFGEDVCDRIIDQADLASNGSYTAVGTYDPEEMVRLVGGLSRETDLSGEELLAAYGTYLFSSFTARYPHFFSEGADCFSFLAEIDDVIHPEVLKLYPDAQLPRFDYRLLEGGRLEMIYNSARPFAKLAEGLIRGCIRHFGEDIDVAVEDLSEGKGTSARFLLTKADD